MEYYVFVLKKITFNNAKCYLCIENNMRTIFSLIVKDMFIEYMRYYDLWVLYYGVKFKWVEKGSKKGKNKNLPFLLL